MTVQVFDLARQRAALGARLDAAMGRVLEHGRFINGPEVTELEDRLRDRLGVPFAAGCASGTEALELLLRADGIGPGDAVIVPSLTFIATAEAVALAGATPVFADVRGTDATLDPASVRAAAAMVDETPGLRLRAVLPVDLFGLPADHLAMSEVCAHHGARLFYDCAHSVGTDTPDGACGSYGDGAATSFYPSKALGCYGDGGAVFARDEGFGAQVRALINHGVMEGRGHAVIGTTGRLDTMQAAVLLEKVALFDAEIRRRREIAATYRAALGSICAMPTVGAGVAPVWSYFAVGHPDRDGLAEHLKAEGIGTMIYYRVPTHRQEAYRDFPVAPGGLPETERFSRTLLCLPMHPYLTDDEVGRVIDAVLAFGGPEVSAAAGYADVA